MTNVLLARTRKRYDAVSWCIDKTRKPGKRDARNSVANEKTTRNQPGCLNLSRNVVCNNSNGEFLPFFFYRKFGKEISALRILWIFLVSKGLILKEEEEKKNKKKIYTKSMQQFFGLLSVISVIEARNGVACWVEGGQRVLYAKNFISNKRIATSFHARFFSSCNGCDW